MAKKKSNVDMKRININAPSTLVNRVKDYADNLGINTTSAYIVLLNQALDQKDTMSNLPVVIDLFNQAKALVSSEDNSNCIMLTTDDNK